MPVPLFLSTLPAGFPSPADSYMEDALDLNELLVTHPAATFFVRVQGDLMEEAHIYSGDVLIVDRSLRPENRSIVVAILDGEFTVKRLLKKEKQILLLPENAKYPPIPIQEGQDFQVWGVVTYVIHKAR